MFRTVTETTLPHSQARAPESRAWAIAPVGKVVSIAVLSPDYSWRPRLGPLRGAAEAGLGHEQRAMSGGGPWNVLKRA